MGSKLYVGNLNYNTTEETLKEAFGADGRAVTSVSIIMDRETGRPRGFAFVEMATPEAAQAALQALDGQMVDGRMLRINEARERERGAPRSFGGPGGPGGPGPRPGAPGGYDPSGGADGSAPPGDGGPRPGGYSGGGGYAGGGAPRPGGFGSPPAGPRPGGFGAPPARNFGPPAAPGGNDARRRKAEKDREKDREGDRGKKGGRKRAIDPGDDW